MSESYKEGGLKRDKYHITKGDGSPCDPEAEYFVLRVDKDPHAFIAVMTYANSVHDDNPELSADIMLWASIAVGKHKKPKED